MDRIQVQSSAELLSLAVLAATDAASRYVGLAVEMRACGNEASASIFDQMATVEREREQLIVEWAKVEGVALDVDTDPVQWLDPGVGTQYDDAARDPIRSTPYRVLAFLVHNAERAFRLFTHIAASTADDMINEYAEILAQEELDRAAQLRSLRRRAWHAERKEYHGEPDIEPGVVECPGDLLITAASLERCVHSNLLALLEDYPQLQQIIDHSEGILTGIDALSSGLVTSGDAATENINSIEAYASNITRLVGDREGLLRRLYRDSDRCFEFYDILVIRSGDEAVMLQAQRLSRAALKRLDLLRELMGPG